MNVERRQHARYAFSCDVTGGPSTRLNQEPAIVTVLTGKVVDLSTGGAGVIGDRPLARLTVVPWRFYLPGVPAPLPVLAQVRWVEPMASQENTFRLGLTFLA
jgi:hypothetical protein